MADKPNTPNCAQVSRLPEEQIMREFENCGINAFVKGSTGFIIGALVSMLITRRSWPVFLGTGFALGIAYQDCYRKLDAIAKTEKKQTA